MHHAHAAQALPHGFAHEVRQGLAGIVGAKPVQVDLRLDAPFAAAQLARHVDADALSFRRPGIGIDVARKLRRGEWTIQSEIDLHGLRTDDAREALATFLREAVRQGQRCVRVVHGKGLGSPGKTPVLKGKVHGWLVQKNEVLAFVQARGDEGGAGAVVVLLKPAG